MSDCAMQNVLLQNVVCIAFIVYLKVRQDTGMLLNVRFQMRYAFLSLIKILHTMQSAQFLWIIYRVAQNNRKCSVGGRYLLLSRISLLKYSKYIKRYFQNIKKFTHWNLQITIYFVRFINCKFWEFVFDYFMLFLCEFQFSLVRNWCPILYLIYTAVQKDPKAFHLVVGNF